MAICSSVEGTVRIPYLWHGNLSDSKETEVLGRQSVTLHVDIPCNVVHHNTFAFLSIYQPIYYFALIIFKLLE